MSKFIVTRDSYFEPLSYDEIVKPLAELQTQHNAAQEAYDKMAMDTAALENYISKEGKDDARAREMYNNYKTKLQTLQDNLWANGINAQTRRDLSAARNAYASDITRLAKAVETRQARSKEYWEARHKNPDLVTGADPGLAGLDKYLDNDRYGQDYFSYNSAQLESDIATEWKTRASEMLRGLQDPRNIVKNPDLESQLTRIIHKGLTNQELNEASVVADNVINMTPEQRNAYYRDYKVSPVSQMMVESLLNRYDATGIRQSDASDFDMQRLYNRGKAGWAAGVLGTDVKDFTDPYFEQRMQLDTTLKKAQLIKTLEGQDNEDAGITVDYDIEEGPGENYVKASSKMDDTFGKNFVDVGGRKVRSGAAASSVIYSEDLRKRMYNRLGFDIGRNTGQKGNPSSFLHGEVVSPNNGQTYEVRFNPARNKDGYTGIIEITEKGKNDWRPEQTLTKEYHDARTEYLNTLNRYKDRFSTPEWVNAPFVDPDKQYKLFQEEGLDFGKHSILDYEDIVMSRPENKHNNQIYKYYVTRNGTDTGKLMERISGYISNNYDVKTGKDKSEILKIDIPGNYTGTSKGIHAVGKDGVLGKEALQPRDVFTMDKDGRSINNIREVYTTLNSIMDTKTPDNPSTFGDGYIIMNVVDKDGKRKSVSVNINELGSGRLKESFNRARQIIYSIQRSNMGETQKRQQIAEAISLVNKDISDLLGFDLNVQTQSGTAKTPQE